ncbi:MAG: DapH/DapD/GlmU-related protein, partial [Planctomycetota bacterium]|nr:DapH/DapD/GlmU-related protein [Planctomycetota bacterium]
RRGVEIGTDCEVGPFAHIRSGSVLGNGVVIGDFVEVNRSQIKDGAKAKHLAYLGDATIEENANIGAGAVVANYDGKKKHHTLIKEGAFVGSGSVIVAPGHVGKNATIGAGAVVPPGKVIEDGTTVIGVPAKKMVKNSQSNSEDGDDEKGS